MIKFINVKRLGVAVTALLAMSVGFSVASCNREKPNVPQEPEKPGVTVSPEQSGVRVLVEYENVNTGAVTRTVLGENGYNFSPFGGNGVVQMTSCGFHYPKLNTNEVKVDTKFFGAQNIVFQGWSWRYADDKVGTHRGAGDKPTVQPDYVKTPALQSAPGMKEMAKASFTCLFRPDKGSECNKVYVKVKYDFFSPRLELPELPPLDPIIEQVCGYCGRALDYGSCNCEEARNYGDNIVDQEFPNPAIEEYENNYVAVYKKNRTVANYKRGLDFWHKAPRWIPGY